MWAWLTPIIQWVTKLVGGWLPIGTKPVSEWLGKILWALGLFAIFMLVWHKFTPPQHTTTVQSGGVCYNVSYKPVFGCMRLPPTTEVKK